jgi:hypothetical protein
VSRGIVLWPDSATSGLIRELWAVLEANSVPSMASHTHRLHQPHVSLIVAEEIPPTRALEALGPVPRVPIRCLVESAGVFPGGFLFLACVASRSLLDEQRRAHEAISPLAVDRWPHFRPGAWTPHITTGWALTHPQLSAALAIVLEHLPIEGWFDLGGVEDGATGERWPSSQHPLPEPPSRK